MKNISDEQADQLRGGTFHAQSCAYNIAFSAAAGGLFGGAGAIIGAAVAASGPSCLALW